jgi:quercetin dioxygenase-like cupin family protein
MDATVKRTALETFDVPGSKYETVMMLVELPPLTKTGFHTHPGFDSAYCLDGSLTVVALGHDDKHIRAAQSWQVPPGIVHEVRVGYSGAKVLAVYVVEKGKPLFTPCREISN